MTDVCEFNQEGFCTLQKIITCSYKGKENECNAKIEDLEEAPQK